MSEVTLTNANFEQEVLKSDLPVLVDFWAEWCGPCRMVAPAVEKVAQKYVGKLKVGKVNVDDQQELAFEYKISSIPTLGIFKDGKLVSQKIGAVNLATLEAFVSQYV
ncbi:MAG: thioredoxin [Sphaerochaetaceae bacterium]